MYQFNPLQEMSTRHLLKKRKLYTADQWRSMMDRLQSLGKNSDAPITGLHTADEYGRRMVAGQTKRIKKAAEDYGRTAEVYKDIRARSGFRTDGPDLIRYKSEPAFVGPARHEEIFYSLLDHNNKNHPAHSAYSRKIIRKKLRDERNAVPELIAGDTLSHEADEYTQALKLARKYNISDPSLIGSITKPVQHLTGNHIPGVLDKEAKRAHLLSTLYGRDSFGMVPRDKFQFAKNKLNYVMNHPRTKQEVNMIHICNRLGITDPYDLETIQKIGVNIDKNPQMIGKSKEVRDYYYELLGKWYKYVKRRFYN